MCFRELEGQGLGTELNSCAQVEGSGFPGPWQKHMALNLCFTRSVTEVETEVPEGESSSHLPGHPLSLFSSANNSIFWGADAPAWRLAQHHGSGLVVAKKFFI